MAQKFSSLSESDLAKIQYGNDLRFWQTYSLDHPTDRLTYGFRKWFVRNDTNFRIVRWLSWILRRAWITLPELAEKHKHSLELLKSTDSNYSVDSKFGDTPYTGEIESWSGYRSGALSGSFGGESPVLYEHTIAKASELILENKITTFFNLGICYPYVDSQLAKKFLDTKFIGIERTEILPILNNHFFADQKNMVSICGDLFDYLKSNSFTNSVFFHSRTMTLLSKSFVERTYKSAAQAGFSFIFGNEQIGVSRESGLPYVFSFSDKPSEIYRKTMFMHNYPAILKEAGYETIYVEAIQTGHPDPDYRILSFIGRLKN